MATIPYSARLHLLLAVAAVAEMLALQTLAVLVVVAQEAVADQINPVQRATLHPQAHHKAVTGEMVTAARQTTQVVAVAALPLLEVMEPVLQAETVAMAPHLASLAEVLPMLAAAVVALMKAARLEPAALVAVVLDQ